MAVTPQVVSTTTGPSGPSMANFASYHRWSPRPTMAAMDGPLCRKWSPIYAFAIQIPSTGLGCSVYVLPKRLTGCWLEATQQRVLSRDPKSFVVINAHHLPCVRRS